MDLLQLLSKDAGKIPLEDYRELYLEMLQEGQLLTTHLKNQPSYLRYLRMAMQDEDFQQKAWNIMRVYAIEFGSEIVTDNMYSDCMDPNGNPIFWKMKVKESNTNAKKWLFSKIESRLQTNNNLIELPSGPRLAISVPAKVIPVSGGDAT